MARCGCGGSCGCSLSGGDNVVVTGSGSSGNPWVIDSHVDCAEARACFSGSGGVNFDSATGVISADVSSTAGNQLVVDANGLFVPAGSNTVSTGPGILGNGSGGNPVRANLRTWPFACSQDANGSVVQVDSSGRLVGEPPYHTYYFELRRSNSFIGSPIAVPAGSPISNVDVPLNFSVTNPDPCRSMRVMWMQEIRMRIVLPAGSSAAYGVNTEEIWIGGNGGTSQVAQSGVYSGKLNQQNSNLAPGATANLVMQAGAGRGTGGATITEIHMSHRVWLMPV